MTTDGADAHKAVEEAARAARGTVADLAGVPGERLDQALRAIADGLVRSSAPVLAANEEDMTAAREAGLGGGLLDRLRLDEARLRPSRTSCGPWPASRTNPPNGRSGSFPAAWCSPSGAARSA